MKVLITAGATMSMIDQVRGITNIFHGTTGLKIAHNFQNSGHKVMLVTSNPNLSNNRHGLMSQVPFFVRKYSTFDQLVAIMKEEIRTGNYDVVIHSAAVSDYQVTGVFVAGDDGLEPVDATTKISSSHDNIFLRLGPTYKIVDKIRKDWGFTGKLVKFKLQVGITDEQLLKIATKSRAISDADLIVANCLEWSSEYAYIVDRDDRVLKVERDELATTLDRLLL